MQLSIWIITISLVVGPVLLGLLLYRLGFSRAVALGLGGALLFGAILVSGDPVVDTDQPQRVASSSSDEGNVPAPDHAAAQEIAGLRSKAAAFEREKAAHEQTQRALEAAKARIAMLAAQQPVAGSQPEERTVPRDGSDPLREAELRLAIARAEIERLKAALRAAEPVATAAPLPRTPQPFAHAVETDRRPDGSSNDAVEIATGATSAEPGNQSAIAGRILAEAMRSQRLALAKINNDDLIQGRRGSYYRITCPGKDGRPLRFGAGDYAFDDGDGPLATCVGALRSLLLDALPKDTEHRLYVQGYASLRGFVRPKPLPARDTHLASFDYLPRIKGQDRFSASKRRQTTGRRYTNAELPNLRAASIAHWVDKSTQGGVRPEVLEGEFKPDNNASSQSFAFLLHIAW